MPHQMAMHMVGVRKDEDLTAETITTRIFGENDPEAMAKLGLEEYCQFMRSAHFGAHLIIRNGQNASIMTAEPGWSLGRIAAWVKVVAEKLDADRFILTCVGYIAPLAISNDRERIPMALGIACTRETLRPYVHGKRMLGDGIADFRGVTDQHIADLNEIVPLFSGLLPYRHPEPDNDFAAERAA